MLPLSALVIKRLELLLINCFFKVSYLFIFNNLSLLLRIKEKRAKPLRIEIDLFLINACVEAGSLLMLDSIFLMNSIVFFFLLVSDKEKLSPNCSRHCTLVSIGSEDKLINHLLRIETGEGEGTFWKNISGFILMLILEELKECEDILCEEGKVKKLL